MKERIAHRAIGRVVLYGIAVVAIGAGIGTVLYSWLVLMPKAAYATAEVEKNLEFVDRLLGDSGQGDGLLARSLDTFHSQEKLISLLPETFGRSADVLRAASETSLFAGKVAKKAEEGVTGLVLPDEETKESAAALQATAGQMRELAKTLDELSSASTLLADDIGGISQELSEMLAGSPSGASRDVQGLAQAIAYLDAPSLVMLGGLGAGGLYLVIGLIALGAALAIPE